MPALVLLLNKIVSVLAGGWSVKGLDLARLPGQIIAVNDAGILAPRVDKIVSMDRLWTEHRWERLKELQRETWLRPPCLINIKERPDWVQMYLCDWQTSQPSGSPTFLNGTNSGQVAINLAFRQEPEVVYLFGFDMGRSPKGEIYWYKPYPWRPRGGTSDGKYQEWAAQFEPIAFQAKRLGIKVLNASLYSRIPVFNKVDPKTILA